jgi:hypothetical protein
MCFQAIRCWKIDDVVGVSSSSIWCTVLGRMAAYQRIMSLFFAVVLIAFNEDNINSHNENNYNEWWFEFGLSKCGRM